MDVKETVKITEIKIPSLLRRLAAMLYDGMIVIFLLILTTTLLMPFTHGAIPPGTTWYSALLIMIWFSFYAWFWTHGGQTLGMLAWKIKVVTRNGETLDWSHAMRRFGFAIPSILLLGFGWWWALFDKDRLAWHDRWSNTTIVMAPKP